MKGLSFTQYQCPISFGVACKSDLFIPEECDVYSSEHYPNRASEECHVVRKVIICGFRYDLEQNQRSTRYMALLRSSIWFGGVGYKDRSSPE